MNIRRRSGNLQFPGDPFSKKVQDIGKVYHEVLFLMKFLPQVKNMIIKYYDLYYTDI